MQSMTDDPLTSARPAARPSSGSSTRSRSTSRARASTRPTTARRRARAPGPARRSRSPRSRTRSRTRQGLGARRTRDGQELRVEVRRTTTAIPRAARRPPRLLVLRDLQAEAGPQPRHEGSSTSVSPDPPVDMSSAERQQAGRRRSVRIACGACQLTHGSRKKVTVRTAWPQDPAQHLLLARGPVEVVLGRRAGVLAHAGEAERLAAVELVLALLEVEAAPEVVERRRADPALVVDGDPAERVDELGEVLEVDLDQVVDLEAVAEEASTVSIISAGPPSA